MLPKTEGRKLTDRRRAVLRGHVSNLTTGDDTRLSFDQAAER